MISHTWLDLICDFNNGNYLLSPCSVPGVSNTHLMCIISSVHSSGQVGINIPCNQKRNPDPQRSNSRWVASPGFELAVGRHRPPSACSTLRRLKCWSVCSIGSASHRTTDSHCAGHVPQAARGAAVNKTGQAGSPELWVLGLPLTCCPALCGTSSCLSLLICKMKVLSRKSLWYLSALKTSWW